MTEERLQRVIDAIGTAPFRYVELRRISTAVLDNPDAVGAVYSSLKKTGRIEIVRREGGFNVYRILEGR